MIMNAPFQDLPAQKPSSQGDAASHPRIPSWAAQWAQQPLWWTCPSGYRSKSCSITTVSAFLCIQLSGQSRRYLAVNCRHLCARDDLFDVPEPLCVGDQRVWMAGHVHLQETRFLCNWVGHRARVWTSTGVGGSGIRIAVVESLRASKGSSVFQREGYNALCIPWAVQ